MQLRVAKDFTKRTQKANRYLLIYVNYQTSLSFETCTMIAKKCLAIVDFISNEYHFAFQHLVSHGQRIKNIG